MNGRKILVVEDEPISQQVVQRMLEQANCQVDIAANGERAIKLFCSTCYQLIFMDIGLPDKSGIEVTQEIRMIEQKMGSASTPIIALTAQREEIATACLAAGMNAVLNKPLLPEQLNTVLATWLSATH